MIKLIEIQRSLGDILFCFLKCNKYVNNKNKDHVIRTTENKNLRDFFH